MPSMLAGGRHAFHASVCRIIPGVNDEPAHFEAVAARVEGARALQRVEFLPYHKTAGAKYSLSRA